ncbi:MAG: hypothetical protein IT318_27700 [Anaerolineales bacterium]|nr:hypothetical protein [Anaerolineales bacterium]
MTDKHQNQSDTPGSITVGDISNAKGVAVGHGASATVTEGGGASINEIVRAFATIHESIAKVADGPNKTMAQQAVQGLEVEAKKGEKADESNVGTWFNFLAQAAPDAFEVAVAAFANPIAGLSLAFKKIADRARQEKAQDSSKSAS